MRRSIILATVCRVMAGLAALAAGWIMLDLYLRVDLPGAAVMAHAAFRALVAPLEWLTEGEGLRLQVLVGGWGAGAVASLLALLAPWGPVRRAGRWFFAATGLLASCFLLLVVSLAVLMERALSAGLLVAVGVAWLLGGLDSHRVSLAAGRGKWVVLVAAAGLGAGASYWVYALFMTYGEGYPMLDFLGGLVRDQGVDFLALYAAATATLGLLAGVLVFWRRGDRVRRPARLLAGATTGVTFSVVLDRAFSLDGPLWTPLLVVPCGLLLAAALWTGLRYAGGRLGSGVSLAGIGRLPLRLVVPFLLALLCIGHAYAARIFRCPDSATTPYGLTRIASLPEVFRVTLFARRSKLALSIRAQRRLGWIRVLPTAGAVQTTQPGPANLDRRSVQKDAGQRPQHLAGVPEDFVHAPSLDRFFVSLTAQDQRLVRADLSVKYHGSLARGTGRDNEINNMIVTVAGDATRVLDVIGVPGLCWLNCMRWNDAERLLYLGCEDRPGLFRYDPTGRVFKDGTIRTSIGDVQDIAFDARARRLYTVSLWKTANLTELDWQTLEIRRQLTIGGSHYDVVHDANTQRVFASAWYGSRVRIVDAKTFEAAGTIPTGLGTRALAVASRQRLLLASSIYDGRLRICNPGNGAILASLPVGGHVKDIAIDEQRGLAYFWSQCGLFRLDLGRWARE